MARKPSLNLSLYLVTDSTAAILGDKDLVRVVDEALQGGITIVQYRDKHADTGRMVAVARRLHEVTTKYNVPLLVNDRIDVALAAGVEGIHIGQDDMSVLEAKRILPPHAIIGVTASSIEEAQKAIRDGADYLGIGTMFGTSTKKDTKSIIGTQGTRNILATCETGTAWPVPCVAIGGINATNVQRILHQTTYPMTRWNNSLNGVAVVSAIMAAENPIKAAANLKERILSFGIKFYPSAAPGISSVSDLSEVAMQVSNIICRHASTAILCHNMTNTVVQNFAANVCLATGSSPIMSMNAAEAADLARLGGALVINMGTVTPDILNTYLAGVAAYNAVGNIVLFDPVGGGATLVRRNAIKTLLNGGFFDVIKGNEGEILAVMGQSQTQQRGVDSGPSTLDASAKIDLVRQLAQRERCVVLMSGVIDYLSDGERTIAIKNGSHWLGTITGSGCSLGSVIASYVAVHRQDKLLAALAGILHYEIAAENAATKPICHGPGTFIPAFLDELYALRVQDNEALAEEIKSKSKVEWV